jgi:hypothetical protein
VTDQRTNEALSQFLRAPRITPQRLADLGLGNVGITFNPHLVLDAEGRRTGWLVKRLRSQRYADPFRQFRRFRAEHLLVDRFFGRPTPGAAGHLPRTAFVIIDWNLDAHPDYLPGTELLMFQEHVPGCSVSEALAPDGPPPAPWLRAALLSFISCYRQMARECAVIPDLFSLRSEHLKVDYQRRRLLLIDTNNLVSLRRDLRDNNLFAAAYTGRWRDIDGDKLIHVFKGVCEKHGYDPERRDSPDRALDLKEAAALQELVGLFPPGGQDNSYVHSLVTALDAACSA